MFTQDLVLHLILGFWPHGKQLLRGNLHSTIFNVACDAVTTYMLRAYCSTTCTSHDFVAYPELSGFSPDLMYNKQFMLYSCRNSLNLTFLIKL